MTELEIAARAAAGAMGFNPNTEWERGRTVAEAVLAVLPRRFMAVERVEFGGLVRQADPLALADNATTSPEVAAIAARGLANPLSLMPDEIQSVCASALVQR